jgi:PKHD-type hydroxylase
MLEANDLAGWKYDITGAEQVQISKYEEGGFYDFHQDGKSDNFGVYNTPENKITDRNIRKLSMGIILNDDYEEGNFQFSTLREEVYTPDFNKLGSIIVFPSFMMHRVKPVTKGTRYSLVSWFVGPPFK